MSFPPIPDGDPPDRREKKGDPWHGGLMVTQDRAIRVAAALFPDEAADGSDCMHEHGREGLPCTICMQRNAEWTNRVAQVRRAMLRAFEQS